MKEWNGSDEEFVIMKGWKKVSGFKIDIEKIADLPDNWDYLYVQKDDLSDYVEETDFWIHDDWEEETYEDVAEIINDKYDDHIDDNDILYDEPVNDA